MKVKILIVRFSSIGDIVLTTPVIRCLAEQIHGDVEIHYLTKKTYRPLLEHNPYLLKIHSIDQSTNEVIADLRAEQFDYIIDLHKNLRSSRVKSRLKALAFSFDKLNWQKWLLVNLKINKLPDVHIVDRYLDTCKALGIENDQKGLDYFLPENIGYPKFIPSEFKSNYTVIVLGANHFTKRIPRHKILEFIDSHKGPFLLIGGSEDSELGQSLEKDKPELVLNCAGKTTLHESAYLIQNSQKVLTPDTGMMHIAAAFKKKILSIWGNTVPEFGMYPYLPSEKDTFKIVENNALKCRPCSKIGFDQCPKKHFKCMEELDLKSI